MGNKGSVIQESLPFHREKIVHNGEFVKFGACHMKGKSDFRQVGESTWRMRVSMSLIFLIITTIYSECSMVTEVHLFLCRS